VQNLKNGLIKLAKGAPMDVGIFAIAHEDYV